MKTVSIIIISGVVVAGLAALYILSKNEDGKGFSWGTNARSNKEPQTLGAGGGTPRDYGILKMQVMLYKGQDLYPNETELLQRYVNLYNGNTNLPVTGVFDEATENAVYEITQGKATTLHNLRFVYLQTKGLNAVAEQMAKGQI